MKRFTWLVVLASVCSFAANQSAWADTIVNIDLEGYRTAGGGRDSNVPPDTFIGVGAAGGGTVFNGINPTTLSDNTASPITGDNQTLSGSNLLNSTGVGSGINFTIGPVGVDNESTTVGQPTNPNALFSDYVFNNSAGNTSNASFTLTGLKPGALYDVYLYHSSDSSIAITGGTPTAATLSGIYNTGNTALFVVNADGLGHIAGTMGGGLNVLNGLSIFSTAPEPSTVALMSVALAGLAWTASRRRGSQASAVDGECRQS
jgi:hypothetical protein